MSDKESESETTITQSESETTITQTSTITASSEVTISNKTPENDEVATTSVTIPISKINEAAPSLSVEAPKSESEVIRELSYSPPPILESEIGGPSEEARSTPSEEGKESSTSSSNDPTPETSETQIIESEATKVNPKNLSPSPSLNMAPSSLPTSSARSTPALTSIIPAAPTSSARSTPALTSTIPAVPSPKSLPAPSPKPSTFTPSPKPSPLAPSPKPMSHAASPKPAMTMPTVYPKPTVSITTTTITAPVATAGKSSSTTTLTSTTTENKEISIVPKRKRSSPKKKNEPKQTNPPKSQFSSPEQMNGSGSNAGQIMYVPVANSMNVPLMIPGLQGNQGLQGMQFMPMFAVRPAGQGNNAGAQFIQMMPNGMFAMQQTQQQPQQQQSHQGQQQPRLIAPATVKDAVSPTKTTAPKSIESKTIRPAEHQNSANQQTLVPVQVPGGNLCFQMSAPGGINSYPRALVKVQGPSIQSKQTNIQPAPVKPIQPKLPTMNDKDAGRRMPTSTQPQLQPRPVMVQTSGGQPTTQVSVASVMSQQNAMANFLNQQNFIPGMAGTIRMPISAAQMNTMTANGMPRMILAQPPVSNANGTGKNQMSNTLQFMQQQGISNLIPMHGIFPGNAQVMAQMGMTTIPTSTTTNGFTHLPSTSSMSMATATTKVPVRKRKAEAIGPNDPNMSVKEYITMSKDPGKLKMEQQHKEEMGPPPVLDAAEDGALAPPVLKPVGEDEENEPPTLLRDEQSDNGINNIFIKEAEMMRKKKSETGENGPIIHFIDGFKIEEDVKPFPIEQQAILEAFESKLKPSSSFKEAQAFKKPGRKPSQKTLLTKEKEKMPEIKTEAEKEEQKVVKKKPGLKEILKRFDPKSCKSPSPPKSMKGRPPMSKQASEDSVDKKERKKPGPKPRVREASKSIDEEPPEKKSKTTVQQALAKKIAPLSKLSTSKEAEESQEAKEKHLIKKKPKRRELEGLLNMDFGPEKSPFPTLKVDEYKQKVLEESLNLRPKSEEKERPGTRSHESSTTSLPNDYISKSDSYDNNFLESNANTLEISPILGQEERRCRNCHKVLPQRPPNEGGFIQYCPKDSIKNCRKEFKRKQKRLAHLENSLSSSSPGAGDVDGSYLYDIRKRSSNGSNSNHPYENRWSSTGSISFFGEQQQQQPSCSTPPNLQRSPLPSPLVCNKSPTSMTIKLRPSPNEPEASTSTGNVQNQQMFQNPGMIPSQGRPSWGQGQPQPIQQARTSTPAAQNDDMERAMEYNQLMEKEVTEWTPNDVARWVNWVVRSDAVGEVFIQEEIDGNALLMLSAEHYESLKKQYNLKMGPSIKLQGALRELKQVYGME